MELNSQKLLMESLLEPCNIRINGVVSGLRLAWGLCMHVFSDLDKTLIGIVSTGSSSKSQTTCIAYKRFWWSGSTRKPNTSPSLPEKTTL